MASEAPSPDAGILLTASIRSATLSNYTAGPLAFIGVSFAYFENLITSIILK
jgi:hypothetical protein